MRLHSIFRGHLAWVALLGSLWATQAGAHAFWLVPYGPRVAVGDQVAFDLRIGAELPGVRTGRLSGLVDYFSLFDAQGQLPVAGRENAVPVGHVRVRQAGAATAVLRTVPRTTDLTAQEFEKYLREELLDDQLKAWRARPTLPPKVTDLYSRCAKSVVLVGNSSAGFDRRTGLPLELILQSDPLRFSKSKPFEIRLELQQKPAANFWIKARLANGASAELKARTDERGVARFEIPQPGLWLFDTVHIEPSASLDADWESLWASLTVEL